MGCFPTCHTLCTIVCARYLLQTHAWNPSWNMYTLMYPLSRNRSSFIRQETHFARISVKICPREPLSPKRSYFPTALMFTKPLLKRRGVEPILITFRPCRFCVLSAFTIALEVMLVHVGRHSSAATVTQACFSRNSRSSNRWCATHQEQCHTYSSWTRC